MRELVGRMLLVFALTGLNAAAWAADREKPPFETLTVSISSTWAWNRTLTIQGDGSYTFQMQALEKVPGEKYMQPSKTPYVAQYRLSAGHMQELTRLLQATEWLAAPAPVTPRITDGMNYAMTLRRNGRVVQRTCQELPDERTYTALLKFLRRINRQEELLFGTTERGKGSPFAGGPADELDSLMRPPHPLRPYAPALDYHRLVPACEKFLLDPKSSPRHAVAAAKLMGYLRLESQRANLEALAQGRTPVETDYKVPFELRAAAVDALGTMGAGPSLEALEKAAADAPSLSGRVAEALMSVSYRKTRPLMVKLCGDSLDAAWALIRKGRQAEPAIIQILRRPGSEEKGNRAAYHLIRAYVDHWKRLSAPPSPAVLSAVHDKVRSVATGGSLTLRYGIDLLRLADDPFLVRDPRQEVEAFLALLADPRQGDRLELMQPLHFRRGRVPEGFIDAGSQGALGVRKVYVEDRMAWVHVSDEKEQTHYGLQLHQTGKVWTIVFGKRLSAGQVGGDLNGFLRGHPKAVELLPGAGAVEADLHARNEDAVRRVIGRLMIAVHDREMETLKRGSIGSVEGWVSAEEAKALDADVPAGWSPERLKVVVDELCDKVYTRNRSLMGDFQALRVTENWAAAHMTGPAGKDGPPGLLVLLQRTDKGWRLVDITEAGGKLEEDMERRAAAFATFRNKLAVQRQIRARDAAIREQRGE